MTGSVDAYRQLSADALDDLARTGQPSAMYQRELAAAVLALTGDMITRARAGDEVMRNCTHSYPQVCMTCRLIAEQLREGGS